MTALATDITYEYRGRSLVNPEVINSDILFAGAYCAAGNRDHGTAASIGRALPWANTAGYTPLGFQHRKRVTGDTSLTEIPRAELMIEGAVLHDVTVTGLAGTEDDFGRLVYMSDDNVRTLTRPSAPTIPLGMVIGHRSATRADVLMFSAAELAVLQLAGSQRGQLTIPVGVGLTASGNLATGYLAPCHGRITSVYGICLIGPTDVDVDIDANLEINGTNVTGGVVEMVTADVAGDKKAGTAVTDNGGNVFHEGDLIDVEGVVNTAGTVSDPGLYLIVAEYIREPGL